MKQSKKLTRRHKEFLKSKGIEQEAILGYRFYKETIDSMIFVINGDVKEFKKNP